MKTTLNEQILEQSVVPWNIISYGKNSTIVSAYKKSILTTFVSLQNVKTFLS